VHIESFGEYMVSKEKRIEFKKGAFREELNKDAEKIMNVAEYVSINNKALLDFAKNNAFSKVSLPKWDLPVFPEKANKATISFIILGNTQNFAFTDFITKQKYVAEYKGSDYVGAMGMWASIKKAIERGVPLLDGEFLSTISYKELEEIYNSKSKIPMLQERLDILNEVGNVLCKKYDGKFYNILKGYELGKEMMFDNGKGFVELLVSDFPSFRDESDYKEIKIKFDKRAQLTAAMTFEKFLGLGKNIFKQGEEEKLSVFADYELPKVLNSIGILNYNESLSNDINNGVLLKSGSKEEVELRAATILAADRIEEEIKRFNKSSKINQLGIDYLLWSAGRQIKTANHHLTITTAY